MTFLHKYFNQANSVRISKLAHACVIAGILTPATLAVAAGSSEGDRAKYHDFYNKKAEDHQNSNNSNSGCRLVMCLIKPGGPMSEKECRHDYKAYIWNLAVPPAHDRPPSIPICFAAQGTNGPKQSNGLVKISDTRNKNGKYNGIRTNNVRLKVQRPSVERGQWQDIYVSTRSEIYAPSNGLVADVGTGLGQIKSGIPVDETDTTRPFGLANAWVADGSIEKMQTGYKNPSAVHSEDLKPLLDHPANPFAAQNLIKMNPHDFDKLVLAKYPLVNPFSGKVSGQNARIIKADAPLGAKFQKNDRVIIARIYGEGNGGNLQEYSPPAVFSDCKATGKIVNLNGKKTVEVLCKGGQVRAHEMAGLVDQSRKSAEDQFQQVENNIDKIREQKIKPAGYDVEAAYNNVRQEMNAVIGPNNSVTLPVDTNAITPGINVLDEIGIQ